jgi:hypothetical protein
MHISDTFLPEMSFDEVEISFANLKCYDSSGISLYPANYRKQEAGLCT